MPPAAATAADAPAPAPAAALPPCLHHRRQAPAAGQLPASQAVQHPPAGTRMGAASRHATPPAPPRSFHAPAAPAAHGAHRPRLLLPPPPAASQPPRQMPPKVRLALCPGARCEMPAALAGRRHPACVGLAQPAPTVASARLSARRSGGMCRTAGARCGGAGTCGTARPLQWEGCALKAMQVQFRQKQHTQHPSTAQQQASKQACKPQAVSLPITPLHTFRQAAAVGAAQRVGV